MTREQLRSLLRAAVASFVAMLMLWLAARLGVSVTIPPPGFQSGPPAPGEIST